jgi:hypothetical protein
MKVMGGAEPQNRTTAKPNSKFHLKSPYTGVYQPNFSTIISINSTVSFPWYMAKLEALPIV